MAEVNEDRWCVAWFADAQPTSESTRATLVKANKWQSGDTITISFLDGTEQQKALVRRFAVEWVTGLANLNFTWQNPPNRPRPQPTPHTHNQKANPPMTTRLHAALVLSAILFGAPVLATTPTPTFAQGAGALTRQLPTQPPPAQTTPTQIPPTGVSPNLSSPLEPDQLAGANRCAILLCVFADNGLGPLVGISPAPNNNLMRFLQGDWYQMNYSLDLGFDDNAVLLYTQPNCAGQPYAMTGSIIGIADLIHPGAIRLTSPPAAGYDGTAVWGPVGPSAILTIVSFKFEGSCSPGSWAPNPIVAAPAVKLDTRSFPLPWKIR